MRAVVRLPTCDRLAPFAAGRGLPALPTAASEQFWPAVEELEAAPVSLRSPRNCPRNCVDSHRGSGYYLGEWNKRRHELKPRNKAAQTMKTISQAISIGLGALALGATVVVQAQAPVITSFSGNGVLVCSNLAPGSVAAVEWASSVTGPWTNNWAGLDALMADSNGMIQVSVPMF